MRRLGLPIGVNKRILAGNLKQNSKITVHYWKPFEVKLERDKGFRFLVDFMSFPICLCSQLGEKR